MIWDGKKKNLINTILLENSILPIEFYPEIVSDQNANLRIRVTQMFGEGMKLAADTLQLEKERKAWVISGPMEITSSEMNVRELLDTEITLNFNQPVVLGFPINGTSYFLEVRINNKKEARNFSGVKDKYKEYTEMVKTDTNFLQPPTPVREVRPVYPTKCKEKNIEGAVILHVEIDEEGNVINIELLKSAHKNLNQAAVEALRQWKYQPVKKDGESVPVTFTVTVDFKLRKAINNKSSETLSENQTELEIILKKCAEYCERLENVALYFICEETIEEELRGGHFGGSRTVSTSGGMMVSVRGGGQNIERNKYVYDYQLIKKGEKIEETRTLLKENGKKKHEKNAPMKTKRFYSRRSVYGPVGWLGKEQQDKYAYRIIKEQTIKKRKTYVIEVSPKIKIEGNPNFGKVWVDKEDFSVLKIEIKQESLAGFEKIEQESEKQSISPVITTTHDYFIEKNGIRFPSMTVCKELYIARMRRVRAKISETRITYDNYRFFLVDVKIKY